jgi:hypothetical protein
MGRPLLGKERRQRYQIVLEPGIAKKIKAMAGGSLSGGVTFMLAYYEMATEALSISSLAAKARAKKKGAKK